MVCTTTPARTFAPPLDAWETDRGYELRLDVPGANAEGVSLQIADGQLLVEAKVPARAEGPGQDLAREYGVGDYRRALTLGEDVDAERITASIAGGVLAVHLPKKAEVMPRKIAVQAG